MKHQKFLAVTLAAESIVLMEGLLDVHSCNDGEDSLGGESGSCLGL